MKKQDSRVLGNVVSLLLLLVVLVILTWMYDGIKNSRYAQKILVPVTEQYDIIAFGDSLVEGLGASRGNDFVSVLSQAVDMPILNLGKRRDTTYTALLRSDDVLAFDPKIVIVVLGGNDVIHGINFEQRIHNLETLIDRFQEKNITVILAGIRTGVFHDDFENQLMQFAESQNVIFVPHLLKDILYNPTMLFDPLHPNDKGYALIAERILPYLVEAIAQRDDIAKNIIVK